MLNDKIPLDFFGDFGFHNAPPGDGLELHENVTVYSGGFSRRHPENSAAAAVQTHFVIAFMRNVPVSGSARNNRRAAGLFSPNDVERLYIFPQKNGMADKIAAFRKSLAVQQPLYLLVSIIGKHADDYKQIVSRPQVFRGFNDISAYARAALFYIAVPKRIRVNTAVR
jgi:hypothetical protein